MQCPICGLDSGETSVMCSRHSSFIYTSQGELIWCNDLGYIGQSKESYPDFVKRKQREIDEHPEWGIKYL